LASNATVAWHGDIRSDIRPKFDDAVANASSTARDYMQNGCRVPIMSRTNRGNGGRGARFARNDTFQQISREALKGGQARSDLDASLSYAESRMRLPFDHSGY
jgi:hypothetical protein